MLVSCSGGSKQAEVIESKTFELDELMLLADQKINDTLTVVGFVTHTCKHSGQRCFIVGESQDVSMRIEAKGEISSFDAELVGSKLAVTGIIKEQRLSQDYIADVEKGVQERIEGGESAESCASELKNIEDMLKWMVANNKDYYAIYYMEGLSFEKLAQE